VTSSNHTERARDYLSQLEELNDEIGDMRQRAKDDIAEVRAKQKFILSEALKDEVRLLR